MMYPDATETVARNTGATVKLDAWRSVFEKTNRILTGKRVTVHVNMSPPSGYDEVPGWSDGERIEFNGPLLKDMLRVNDAVSAVLRLKGLNYHELAHVLYTPRMTEELPKRIVEKARTEGRIWWYAFNALEDQRIETWFTASYGTSSRYFEAAVLEWLLRHGTAEAAILMHGRKYLPARIRVQAGRVFVKKYGQPLWDEFKKVIDAYLSVVLPRDSVKARTLITKYVLLLQQMQQAHNAGLPSLPVEDNGMSNHSGHPEKGDPSAVRIGRAGAKEQQEAADAAQQAKAKADKADAEAKAEIEAEKAQGKAEEAESGDGDGDEQGGESEGGESKSGGDKDGTASGDGVSGESDSAQAGGSGAGGGHAEHEILDETIFEMFEDLVKEAQEGLEDVMDDDQIVEDAERTADAVQKVIDNGKIGVEGLNARVRQTVSASPDELLVVRRVVNVLTRIKQDAEPQILHRQPAGRVDLGKIKNQRPGDFDIFRTYDEGSEEETGIEAVILMDVSGSMAHRMKDASFATWALKRAFDKLDIRTTALVFDTEHQVLFQPTDKAGPRIPVVSDGGGTDPTSALNEAYKVLRKSHQPNKVLITVTDGGWQGHDDHYRAYMKNMHKLGVHSMILGLDNAVKVYGKHDHSIGHDIANVGGLPKAALSLVSAILRNATNQV